MNVECFLPLARIAAGIHIGKGLVPANVERDDLVQSAMLRLHTKFGPVEPDENTQKFAFGVARWGVQDEVRRAVRFEPFNDRLLDGASAEQDPFEQIAADQEAEILREEIARLSPGRMKVMQGLLEERDQREMATEFGVTESNISYLKARCIEQLRTRLRARGIHR